MWRMGYGRHLSSLILSWCPASGISMSIACMRALTSIRTRAPPCAPLTTKMPQAAIATDVISPCLTGLGATSAPLATRGTSSPASRGMSCISSEASVRIGQPVRRRNETPPFHAWIRPLRCLPSRRHLEQLVRAPPCDIDPQGRCAKLHLQTAQPPSLPERRLRRYVITNLSETGQDLPPLFPARAALCALHHPSATPCMFYIHDQNRCFLGNAFHTGGSMSGNSNVNVMMNLSKCEHATCRGNMKPIDTLKWTQGRSTTHRWPQGSSSRRASTTPRGPTTSTPTWTTLVRLITAPSGAGSSHTIVSCSTSRGQGAGTAIGTGSPTQEVPRDLRHLTSIGTQVSFKVKCLLIAK